jgi:DNA-binding NarL/FixJ family response regulator
MRIILADDHSLVRESLRDYLAPLAPELDVTETDCLAGVLAARNPAPDLILLDLQMPGMNGPQSIAEVRGAFPNTPIVVISGYADHLTVSDAIRYGANGYVPKASGGKSFLTALRFVLAGETYLPATVLTGDAAQIGPGSASSTPEPVGTVTEREVEVLRLLIAGKSNKEIGRELSLQEVTVKVHLRNIYRKIGASNRADAVRIAIVRSLVRS